MKKNNDEKLIDMDEEEWMSYSKNSITYLLTTISKKLFIRGVQNYIGDTFIQANSFNIKFIEKDYGCAIRGYIFKNNKDSDSLREIWQALLSENEIWGQGPNVADNVHVDVSDRRNRIKELYKLLTIEQMARRFGVSRSTINRDLKKLGINRKKANNKEYDTVHDRK